MDVFGMPSIEVLEEELEEPLLEVKIPRIIAKDRSDPFHCLSDEEFLERYRLPKDTTRDLIEEVRPRAHVDKMGRGCGIPLNLKMLVTLRYLATGNFLLTIADCIDIAKSSACRAVGEVVQLIAYLAPDYIQFPPPEAAHHLAEKFHDVGGMPGVIGCVDGTHIPIQSPGGENAEDYRCRKGFFSLNVQGICDSDMKFTNIVASWPGSVHDDTIFENSHVCNILEQGNYNGFYLLGDSDYQCRENLLTPIPEPKNEKERNYNASHAKTRNCVERAFSVLKRRFACLSIPLRTKLTNSKRIVMACVVLHNIAVSRKVELLDDEVLPQENVELIRGEEIIEEVGVTQGRDSVVQRWF